MLSFVIGGEDTSTCTRYYDSNWDDNKYIFSTSETAFEISLLKRFDAELLIGQVSYSQKAEIYNSCNGYPVLPKECTSLSKEEKPKPVPSRSLIHLFQSPLLVKLNHT